MKIKSESFLNKGQTLFSILAACSFTLAPVALAASCATECVPVMGACGRLFDIDANAAGLTVQERAMAIQKNLDCAIVKAKHRSPAAVQVAIVNRNPVVMLDGFHIATADGNSAARHNISQMELALAWARSIKLCLADAGAIDRQMSMLTGCFPQAPQVARTERIAVARSGLFLPVRLTTPINSECSQIGDCVEACLVKDVPLPTSYLATEYEAYLPAGTVALGRLVESSNSYLGRNAFSVRFEQLRTPSGELIPINGHIFGGVGTWIAFNPEGNERIETGTLKGLIPIATKGSVCAGWRGNPIGASPDIPFQKLAFKRRTGVAVPSGEPMLLQLSTPTVISICTNCCSPAM